jgi:hypothetical protein
VEPEEVKGLSPLRALVSHRTIKDKETKNAISGVEEDRPCRHQGPRVEVGDCEHHKAFVNKDSISIRLRNSSLRLRKLH